MENAKLFPKNVHLCLGLTPGSVKDTSKMKKKYFIGLEIFGTVPYDKLDLLPPRLIKLYNFCIKRHKQLPLKNYSSDEVHVNVQINVNLKKRTGITSRRMTLEHSRSITVLTLVLVQISLRERREKKSLQVPPPTKYDFSILVTFPFSVDR